MSKKVEIKIAVAIDEKGNWSASGWSGDESNFAMAVATESMQTDFKTYYVTAILDIPEINILKGTVECHQD